MNVDGNSYLCAEAHKQSGCVYHDWSRKVDKLQRWNERLHEDKTMLQFLRGEPLHELD